MSGETATRPQPVARPGPSRRPGRAITAGVVAAAVLVGAICLALMATNPDSGDAGTWSVQLAANLFTIGVGLVMWHARPGNRVGPLVILMGFAGAVAVPELGERQRRRMDDRGHVESARRGRPRQRLPRVPRRPDSRAGRDISSSPSTPGSSSSRSVSVWCTRTRRAGRSATRCCSGRTRGLPTAWAWSRTSAPWCSRSLSWGPSSTAGAAARRSRGGRWRPSSG